MYWINRPAFWWFSLLWNALIALLLLSDTGGPLHEKAPVWFHARIRSVVAVVCSGVILLKQDCFARPVRLHNDREP